MRQRHQSANIPLTVFDRRPESADCQSVVFKLPRNFQYSGGQWMDLGFPDDPSVIKTFSMASSPTEPNLVISFKNGITKYKKALAAVRPGDTMIITQYGGYFLMKPRQPILFIAGGIGIAPIRSMIKEAIDTGASNDMMLIFTNGSDDFPFKADLDEWNQFWPDLSVQYLNTKQGGRLSAKTLRQLVPDAATRQVYIAGPPAMVDNAEHMLFELGVKLEQIRTDSFGGY